MQIPEGEILEFERLTEHMKNYQPRSEGWHALAVMREQVIRCIEVAALREAESAIDYLITQLGDEPMYGERIRTLMDARREVRYLIEGRRS